MNRNIVHVSLLAHHINSVVLNERRSFPVLFSQGTVKEMKLFFTEFGAREYCILKWKYDNKTLSCEDRQTTEVAFLDSVKEFLNNKLLQSRMCLKRVPDVSAEQRFATQQLRTSGTGQVVLANSKSYANRSPVMNPKQAEPVSQPPLTDESLISGNLPHISTSDKVQSDMKRKQTVGAETHPDEHVSIGERSDDKQGNSLPSFKPANQSMPVIRTPLAMSSTQLLPTLRTESGEIKTQSTGAEFNPEEDVKIGEQVPITRQNSNKKLEHHQNLWQNHSVDNGQKATHNTPEIKGRLQKDFHADEMSTEENLYATGIGNNSLEQQKHPGDQLDDAVLVAKQAGTILDQLIRTHVVSDGNRESSIQNSDKELSDKKIKTTELQIVKDYSKAVLEKMVLDSGMKLNGLSNESCVSNAEEKTTTNCSLLIGLQQLEQFDSIKDHGYSYEHSCR
ncbi:hypothetical protein P879_05031 [Paragonimus westermani]|uniref:Uncharacterized protein n=1 Tax=Paragonimus westermani TaxID=34504 RepID=A0A8T0DPA4_9TREM|nr:hypothetical protein P879_05031 [Paragonimus westermani]